MKNVTILFIAVLLGAFSHIADAQAPAKDKKSAPKKAKPAATAKTTKPAAVKTAAHPVKDTTAKKHHAIKHHKKKPASVSQIEEAIELENGKQRMVIDINHGGVYINGDLVSTIADAKKESHKIIINIRDEDTVEKKPVADEDELQKHRAMLGVYTEPGGNNDGARVVTVVRNSPAAEAGLMQGDLITMVNSRVVKSSSDLVDAISDHNSGEKITITFDREGHDMHAEVILEDAMPHRRYATYEYRVPDLHGDRRMPPAFFNSSLFMGGGNSFEYAPEMGISAKTDKHERGVKVLEVKPNSPADDAGLQAGDIIVRLDRFRISTIDDLQDVLDDTWMNQKVHLEFRRDGKLKSTHMHFTKERTKRDF